MSSQRWLALFGFLFLFLPSTSTAQTASCRGTGTSGSGANTALLCAGTCSTGSCADRNGTGNYIGYKICNCAQGDTPNGCCGLALKRVGAGSTATFQVTTVGDCIGCGFEDRVCTKMGAAGSEQALCIGTSPPVPTPQ